MIKIIAAVSSNGIMGLSNTNSIPFHYSEDLKFFKEQTINSTIIMGRKTFQSLNKPLPKRRNVVITSQSISNIETYISLDLAINKLNSSDIWLIGGESIYHHGMKFAQEIKLTITPDIIDSKDAIKFPWINPLQFQIRSISKFENNSPLQLVTYARLQD